MENHSFLLLAYYPSFCSLPNFKSSKSPRAANWWFSTRSYFWTYNCYLNTGGQVKTHSRNQIVNGLQWCNSFKQLPMLHSHLILSPLKLLWIFPLTSMGFRSCPEHFLKTSDKSKPFPLEWDCSRPLVKTISFPNTAFIPESCQLWFFFFFFFLIPKTPFF